jgi:xanthine dehydrogenase accessory factor
MLDEFLTHYNHLRQHNELFATATVVWREAPSSGHVGDRAIINSHGDVSGWVGGGCTKGIVLKEANAAMQDGNPRLVRVSPNPDAAPQAGITAYKMTCQSGGSVDIFIEPVIPHTHLIIMGKSAIARALAPLAKLLGYTVTVMAMGVTEAEFPGVDDVKMAFGFAKIPVNKHTFVVVATQGDSVFAYLQTAGISDNSLSAIKTPAGLDIKARTPNEVAISILAEIIQTVRSQPAQPDLLTNLTGQERFYINPVCQIPVDKTAPKHVVDYKGETVYFCCDGCKVKFDANPSLYIPA